MTTSPEKRSDRQVLWGATHGWRIGSACKVGPEAPPKCVLCPRLVAYRAANAAAEPAWFNGAVPSFGPETARLLIVGLAPGRNGANRTGRPFTGDYAGDLLYATLFEFGFATGTYAARPDDGFQLKDCMITNAVRCVPPENKPTPDEIKTCRPYFRGACGCVAETRNHAGLGPHRARSDADGVRLAKGCSFRSAHGARHDIGSGDRGKPACSTTASTARATIPIRGGLTADMFRSVFAAIKK